ncbi:MAG: hypothetical protein PHI64_19130 [Zoogloea sp.]|uniref:hypothetical protein n=1 Tax=Zoogloea sp. TaxID=49181 RepID=UPI0026023BD6|nr:hypothetical protein [Zoogloea sp.]MDD2991053.1 hypothetical protein [Zoogloea sp.]
MKDRVYCYHCMTHHPREAMRRVMTRTGERWRCVRSIEGAQGNTREREAFGERQTEVNRARARSLQQEQGRRWASLR